MRTSTGRVIAALAMAIGWALGAPGAAAAVVLNEVHYNPSGDDDTVRLEFLELHNTGSTGVDLSAWRLEFGPEPFVFPTGSTIGPGQHVVVAESVAQLDAATGHMAAYTWAGLDTGLDNGGDTIVLRNAASTIVDQVTYDDDPPWPTGADGSGPSLELLDPALDNALPSSWRASVGADGTPGARNSVFSTAPTVKSETPRRLDAVQTLPSVSVTFSESVSGVTANDLTVGGSPAASVSCTGCAAGKGAGPYTFTGYAAPPAGSVTIRMAPGGIEAADGTDFRGDTWTVSVGLLVVLNEFHYHPADPDGDAEFVEIHNAGTNVASMGGWRISDGIDMVFPAGTTLAAGGFLVIARDPARLQAATGFSGALAWTDGGLDNGGERIALSDASGNELDVVTYGDGGTWPAAPDGGGPSAELIHPKLANAYGGAWKASTGDHGTPGARNSVFEANPAPLVFDTRHEPALPAAGQSLTITARVLDEKAVLSVTLYSRADRSPTIAYASQAMLDDGAHGDVAAGDGVYGAVVAGLGEGERLDFTIRATDDSRTTAAPSGHDTLLAGGNPSRTYLSPFSSTSRPTDFPLYHLVTTQHVRDLQTAHNEDEHDATFIRCPAGAPCEIFYNVVERYRGETSLNQHPHGFRVDFPPEHPLHSEMGFDVERLLLVSQSRDKQALGYQFFREAFGGAIPASRTQFARLRTNPLSHGGSQDYVYVNVERVDADFLSSQDGDLQPRRYPDRCSVSGTPCEDDLDCGGGETCVETDSGNLYEGEGNAALQYLGASPEDGYRTAVYQKHSNEEEDDWDDLIDLCWALDPDTTSSSKLESRVKERVDEQEWARWFAIHMLLVNQEGGLYRDTGDDYYVYFEPPSGPRGVNATLIPWDMDSTFGGFGTEYNQESIWRTTTETPRRFLRSNAFAGRFVGAICTLLDEDFTQASMNARIDALPKAVASSTRKQALKDWVAARRSYVAAEIVDELTVEGVPASPYGSDSPVISLKGTLDQCGARRVTVNGTDAKYDIAAGTWSRSHTLVPGMNTIVVRELDHQGVELARVTRTVEYVESTVVTFQQGAGGYASAFDTYLHAGSPGTNNGNAAALIVDGGPPDGDVRQVLLRFEQLFASRGGPIPAGAEIITATLTLNIVNGSVDGAWLHRMLARWDPSSTWASMGAGVQVDGVEALAAPDAKSAYNGPKIPAKHEIDVTASVKAWAGGATVRGWVFRTPPPGNDSWQFDSSDAGTVANRPKLAVAYTCTLPQCDPSTVAAQGSIEESIEETGARAAAEKGR